MSLRLGVATFTLLVFAAHAAMGQSAAAPTPYYLGPPTLDVGWTPGESPASTPLTVQDIFTPHKGHLNVDPLEDPQDFLANKAEALSEASGLRFAVAYTMPFMQATGNPGNRYGGAGDLDLMSVWTLVGRGSRNTGELVVSGEYRFSIGSQPPSDIRASIGALIAPVSGFNDRGWVLRNAYWSQRLLGGRLRFIVGRADPAGYFGTHWLQSADVSFMNRHFAGHPSVPSPGHGPTAGVSIRPRDSYYVTVGASDAYGDTTKIEIGTLTYRDFFTFAEVGLTPRVRRLAGRSRYSIAPWYMMARQRDGLPASKGFILSVNQELTDRLTLIGRYAYTSSTVESPGTDVAQQAQAGLGLRGMFGNMDDLAGIAFSIAIPRNGELRQEKVTEIFYRCQFTRRTQLSAGVQAIFDPSRAPTPDTVGVIYVRLRTSF
jgi:porin